MNKKLFILLLSSICFVNTFTAERRPLFDGRISVSPTPSERIGLLFRIIPTSPRKRQRTLRRMIFTERARIDNINKMESSKNNTSYMRLKLDTSRLERDLDVFYSSKTFAQEHEEVIKR